MPTYERTATFDRDLANLTPEQRARFRVAVVEFIADLVSGSGFRAGLRIKRVRSTDRVWELTWAPDGRATWEYGVERMPGEPHVIWRRVGTHVIFERP